MAADEFVMLLPETDLNGAKVVADRLWAVASSVVAESPSVGKLQPKIRIGGAIFGCRERVTASITRITSIGRSRWTTSTASGSMARFSYRLLYPA